MPRATVALAAARAKTLCENRTDARRPPESKREAQEKAAEDARLRAGAAKVNITIEPLREDRPEKADDGKGEKMDAAELPERGALREHRNKSQADKKEPARIPLRTLSLTNTRANEDRTE